jgi:hypothetical protein
VTIWNVNISTTLMKFILWLGRDSLLCPRKSMTYTSGRIAETGRWRCFTRTKQLTFTEQHNPVMNVPANAFAECDVLHVLTSHTEGCGSAAHLMPRLAGKFPAQATDPIATLPKLAADHLRDRIGDEGRGVTN